MPTSLAARIRRPDLIAGRDALAGFAHDVRDGLGKSRKELPPQYLYDAVGSALFEAITVLPEYGLTRAEERLLGRHATEIAYRLAPTAVVELGSGSGRKTAPILCALANRQRFVSYIAIDVSATALAICRRQLGGLAGVRVRSVQRPYLEGLRELNEPRLASERLLVLFLGSSIGNFSRGEIPVFLRQIRQCLRAGDALLLGTDLIQSPEQLIMAYDDPAGVTAAFNLNLLSRINRELEGDFHLRSFRHEARWSTVECRIEMHLVSQARQFVSIPRANCRVCFEEGETIWTESCHKFVAADLPQLAAGTGFVSAAQWTDPEWPFAENLWIVDD
jgi:L-histidine N-alpha-methyltransferase